MRSLLSLIREPRSSLPELRRALSEISIGAFESAVAQLEAERHAVLLDGTDDTILAHDAKLAAARLDRDRAIAAHSALNARIAEAQQREAAEALQAERDAVETEAAATAAALARTYPEAARTIAELFTRLQAAEEAVDRVNAKLREAGRLQEQLAAVETRVIPTPPDEYAPAHALANRVVLPEIPSFAPGWPKPSLT